MEKPRISRKKIMDNFMINNYQLDILLLLKKETGINKSEQVRMALDDFFIKMNVDVESFKV